MAHDVREPAFFPRDGTSQKARVLAALDPASVRPDERTLQDLVVFARELGKDLVYYGQDDRPAGTWADFIGALEPEAVAAFVDHPERFDPAQRPALFRPHFVLFLAFLKLFERAQQALNDVVPRHLEFYFRRILQMAQQGPVLDRVHLIFELARGEPEILVPAGSLASAGPDSLGREQVYRTEQPIVVNRIQIAKKRTVFVERRRTGFAEARAKAPGDPVAGFVEMLRLVLGDPLPAFPGEPEQMSAELLRKLHGKARATAEFYLTMSDIAEVIKLNKLPDSDEKTEKLEAVLNRHLPPEVPPRIDDLAIYWIDVLVTHWNQLEGYFHMDPEDLDEILQRLEQPDEDAWCRVDTLLDDAYRTKVRADRIERFRTIHEATPEAAPKTEAEVEAELAPLICVALDDHTATKDDLTTFLESAQVDQLLRAATNDKWDIVYDLLEIAERNRTGDQPAQTVHWIDLVAADDADTANARPAAEGQSLSGRWATFGLPRLPVPAVPPPAVLGWAVSSPLLWLREGTRTITLTLGIRRPPEPAPVSGAGDVTFEQQLGNLLSPPDGSSPPLVLQASTTKGWIDCAVDVTTGALAALLHTTAGTHDLAGVQFTTTLEVSVDPLAPLPAKLSGIDGPWPAVRLMLRPIRGAGDARYETRYQELASLSVVVAHLQVNVTDLAPRRLQNDERRLDPKKPFEPLGIAPAIGSRLLIGHPEVSGKKLDCLTLDFDWMSPKSFIELRAHYQNYTRTEPDPQDPAQSIITPLVFLDDLILRLSMIDRGRAVKLAPTEGANADVFTDSPTISVESFPDDAGHPAPELMSGDVPDDVSAWSRYLQCELAGADFGHAVYPAIASSKAVELAAEIATQPTRIDASLYKVNPPYTPKLKGLTLSYSASHTIRLDTGALDADAVRVVHIHPFGFSDVEREPGAMLSSSGAPLLPRYDHDGELYLGLAGVAPPQNVALLFQLAEGSADPALPSQTVEWCYLDGDRWVPLAHRVVRDTTGGLVSSGIIELALDPVKPSTRLGSDSLYWIRAAVEQSTASVCDTIDIHPQAVSAVFVDHDNAPDHFRQPLPAQQIKKLSVRIPGVAAVRQPYTSHGGRPAEDPGMWATRVSERLRHKQRALSTWDYERLVLERFPQIYKARCLPASAKAPGKVEIIVIPDIRNLLPSDPYEPKAPASLLGEIAAYLRNKSPAFADITVRNAIYTPFLVHLVVRFTGNGNEAFYIRKLNHDINQFLSPWAFDDGSDIVLGGRIYVNSIVDFVDRRDYVEYVADVKLYRYDAANGKLPLSVPEREGDFIAATGPDVVLVAARKHEITAVKTASYDDAAVSGINFMTVELDFIVA